MNTKLNHAQNWHELAQKANWSVSRMANLCKVSPRTLGRFFLKSFAKSPKAWLKMQRQKQAITLLRDGVSVKEAAAALGYADSSHFSKEFRANNGRCPTKLDANFL